MSKVSSKPKSKAGPAPPKAATETAKRKKAATKKSVSNTVSEGETPEDHIALYGSGVSKDSYTAVTKNARIEAEVFLKNLDKNVRMIVPITNKARAKLDGCDDYFPAVQTSFNSSECIIVQAPTSTNFKDIWRSVWQDQTKVMVCLCTENEMSDNDDKKCYKYFPTEVGKIKEVPLEKGKFLITCKKKEMLSIGAAKYEFEMICQVLNANANAGDKALKDDDPTPKKKNLPITMLHFFGWTGKPEAGLEEAHNVALAAKEVHKADFAVIRDMVSPIVPPVIIQSFDGMTRAGVFNVALWLIKDTEKRECFDVPFLIENFKKYRIGSFRTYYQLAFTYAMSLWMGKEENWLAEEDFQQAWNDLMKGYKQRKLDEHGRIL